MGSRKRNEVKAKQVRPGEIMPRKWHRIRDFKKYVSNLKLTKFEDEKREFLLYMSELPNFDLASGWIGRDSSTVYRWKKDTVFAEAISQAKSFFAQQNVPKVKNREWVLERTLRKEFAPPEKNVSIKAEVSHNVVMLPGEEILEAEVLDSPEVDSPKLED